jgi:hypothetical protein
MPKLSSSSSTSGDRQTRRPLTSDPDSIKIPASTNGPTERWTLSSLTLRCCATSSRVSTGWATTTSARRQAPAPLRTFIRSSHDDRIVRRFPTNSLPRKSARRVDDVIIVTIGSVSPDRYWVSASKYFPVSIKRPAETGTVEGSRELVRVPFVHSRRRTGGLTQIERGRALPSLKLECPCVA